MFSVSGYPYSRVCGRIRAYQCGTPDALVTGVPDINNVYVDGVSITHSNPRQHVLLSDSMSIAHGPLQQPILNHYKEAVLVYAVTGIVVIPFHRLLATITSATRLLKRGHHSVI